MTMGVDLAELPGDALSLLDAVDEGRLEASAQEVLAWNRRSPMFAQALRDLLFAHELWRETRERFEAANREASAAADRPITVAALSRCPGFRPAARRRRPRAVHLAIAALVLVAFAVFLRGPCTSPPRELLGTEIAIDPRSFAPELDGALRWSDAALAEGDAFRVRLKRGVQILELARVVGTEWRPEPPLDRSEDCAIQVQRLDAFRRVTGSSDWFVLPRLAGH
jgi:hypothetical protein